MVWYGVSWHGKGSLRILGQKERLTTETYGNVLANTYAVDIFDISQGRPYIFQQDGASCHTSPATQARCRGNMRDCIPKRTYDKEPETASGWPPNSPDLNPLDYFVCGWMQNFVSQEKPDSLLSLQSAIRKAAAALPIDLARKAIGGLYKRVWLATQAGGRHFKHWAKRKDIPPAPERDVPMAEELIAVEINNLGEDDGAESSHLANEWEGEEGEEEM